jgi:hypothetical protein
MTCIGTIPRLAALALSIFILSMTTGYAYVRNHRNGIVIPNGGTSGCGVHHGSCISPNPGGVTVTTTGGGKTVPTKLAPSTPHSGFGGTVHDHRH